MKVEEILQDLIRYDTTNPPGGERECALYLRGLLQDAGLDTYLLSKGSDARSNLLARLDGTGDAPPLLLYGHMDVVTTEDQNWTCDPFGGVIDRGYVHGRGALDMKGGLAMMVHSLLRLQEAGERPKGDVIFAALCDEEEGSEYGAKFLVEEHPRFFDGVRYGIGEFGGFSLELSGQRFYPIQVAEKTRCWMRATFRGPSGHGSLPLRDGAMARLGRVLTTLNEKRLPVHVTPVVREMVEQMAEALPRAEATALRGLLKPLLTDRLLSLEQLSTFDPLLHNTVNATVVRGGEKVNVIPGEVQVKLDGRLLPGYTPDDLIAELEDLLGIPLNIEVLQHDQASADPDLSLFPLLSSILREQDREAVPVPMLLPGSTDARFFSGLGIQSYGYLPMRLPADFSFMKTIHAADERVPVSALRFGEDALYKLLLRYE